ncbi:14764_t:CDS:2 [Acaulospora morrowiae]|uniref:14764_t:CDS:1 n=1 Tax=Acaulospora morrowiae TaxID=94023 RepID=A0A9N8Z910_9GLOM|nr:14764_t:CDS:2 [Acaulospora morrowiae]
MTQETATTSFTSISSIEETDEIKKFRYFWWKTGNMHPKARWEEAITPASNIPDNTSNSSITPDPMPELVQSSAEPEPPGISNEIKERIREKKLRDQEVSSGKQNTSSR